MLKEGMRQRQNEMKMSPDIQMGKRKVRNM